MVDSDSQFHLDITNLRSSFQKPERQFKDHESVTGITSVAIIPDRRRIVTSSTLDNTLRKWRVGPEDRCCI
ncbi:hypothetical protein CY34DRAFT_808473, partial [Suillus luteus UH-Slu-Lm8-n1]